MYLKLMPSAAPRLSVAALVTLCLALTACAGGGAPQADSDTGKAVASPTAKTARTPTENSPDSSEFCQDVKMQFAALRFLPMSIGSKTEQQTLDRVLKEVQQLRAAAPAGVEKDVANLEEVITTFRNDPSQYESETLLDAMNDVEGWASTNC